MSRVSRERHHPEIHGTGPGVLRRLKLSVRNAKVMGDIVVLEAWNDGTGPGAHDLVGSLPSAIGGEGKGGPRRCAWDAARGGRKQVLRARGRKAKLGVFPGRKIKVILEES